MRAAGDNRHGRRLRGLIVVVGRAGLRVQEALALAAADLDQCRGALLVRRGKGGRRREIGMDAWGFEQLEPWFAMRRELPSVRCLRHQRHDARSAVVERQRQLGHSDLGLTSVYLQGIDSGE